MRRTFKAFAGAPLSARIGIAVIAGYVVIALVGPLISPYPEAAIVAKQYQPWSMAHPLGTDEIGRDVLSRMIYGARNTVGVAILTTFIAFFVGVTGGLLASTVGGFVDQLLSQFIDVLLAIPALIFALLILTITGTSVISLVLVIALLDATRIFRLSRALADGIVTMDFIEVARLRGESVWWIIRYEVLPNATAPLIAEFGLRFCYVFLFISALSFLGLGLQPPTADWGSMVRDGAKLIAFASFDSLEGISLAMAPLIPAAAIALLTLMVNQVADWLLNMMSNLD